MYHIPITAKNVQYWTPDIQYWTFFKNGLLNSGTLADCCHNIVGMLAAPVATFLPLLPNLTLFAQKCHQSTAT
jgi:hypothetical protein